MTMLETALFIIKQELNVLFVGIKRRAKHID